MLVPSSAPSPRHGFLQSLDETSSLSFRPNPLREIEFRRILHPHVPFSNREAICICK
uniref:Uncharacterized protein n=1 Tax=Setaria viridis TaxID=4556 RepID=A0A4V6D8A1_SETVI|nr:hypothetical protein SEVIR_4G170601v2 [Setaria viridis]